MTPPLLDAWAAYQVLLTSHNSQDAGKDEPFRVRPPGFISDQQVALGDVAAGAVPPP